MSWLFVVVCLVLSVFVVVMLLLVVACWRLLCLGYCAKRCCLMSNSFVVVYCVSGVCCLL